MSNDKNRIDKFNRMNDYLFQLMKDEYIINSGRYFLTGGEKQYHLLSEDDKLQMFAEGSKWIVDHERKIVTIYGC